MTCGNTDAITFRRLSPKVAHDGSVRIGMEAMTMGQETTVETRRPMRTEALGEWRVDPMSGLAVLVKPIGPAPERWLQWAAPYLDPALMDVWAPEPVSLWSNIAGVLRCSERQARILSARHCFEVDLSTYRVRTTLREVWDCLSSRIPRAIAP